MLIFLRPGHAPNGALNRHVAENRFDDVVVEVIHKGYLCTHQFLGGGNSNIFGILTPKIGEDEPNLTCAYFSDGWFNHQLDTGYLCT